MPLATGTRQGRARRGVDPGSRFWSVRFVCFTFYFEVSNSRTRYIETAAPPASPDLNYPFYRTFQSLRYGFPAGAPRASRHPPALVLHNPLPVTATRRPAAWLGGSWTLSVVLWLGAGASSPAFIQDAFELAL